MITAHFQNVGRSKKSWSATLKANPLDVDAIEAAVAREAKRNGGLMSRQIGACMDGGDTGFISAGFHTVGRFKIGGNP
jgi:hypothetical protein